MKMRKSIINYLGMIFNSSIWFIMSFLFSMFLLSLVSNKYYVVYPLIIGVCVLIITVVLRSKLLHLLINNFVYSTTMYLLFMIGIFGFFMGVPVFCIFPGIIWAKFYITTHEMEKNTTQRIKHQRYILIVSLIFLLLFMIMSAIIALMDLYTADAIKGMLGLKYTVTQEMIYSLIIFGGIFLFLTQYIFEYFIFHNAEKKILTTAST